MQWMETILKNIHMQVPGSWLKKKIALFLWQSFSPESYILYAKNSLYSNWAKCEEWYKA